MNVWRCPKCPYVSEQPAHVTGIAHRCKPNIPRAVRLVQVNEHERTSDDS